ncbi:MAG: 16S rRNA methyltransferase [Chloroflexi bacterium OHK40]
MGVSQEHLDALVAEVLSSPKYAAINPELVRAVGARELAVRRTLREAVKETRGRLHQVAGAFLDRAPRYDAWLATLRAAQGKPAALRGACQTIMASHASTRERLPELERFYDAIFAALPPVDSLIDLACGLNPLAAPWMGLKPGAHYAACDIYSDMCAFLGAAIPLLGLRGDAAVCDLAVGPPSWRADAALLLKTLPVLEHLRRGAGRELLRAIQAPWLVVSFPTRSLGGRNVGMAATYGGQMRQIADAEGWTYESLEFMNEVVFLVRKG